MKLLLSFNYWEIEFLLKKAVVLDKTTLYKDKKQASFLYLLKLNDKKFYLAQLGMTVLFVLPSLQKLLINNPEISEAMVFGSAGSYDKHVGKLVVINRFYYKENILNKYFSMDVKIPKWFKRNFKKIEIFHNITVNDIEVLRNKKEDDICYDMESGGVAYLFKLNHINSVFFRIITDSGDIDFGKMKRLYNSNSDLLFELIEFFLNFKG